MGNRMLLRNYSYQHSKRLSFFLASLLLLSWAIPLYASQPSRYWLIFRTERYNNSSKRIVYRTYLMQFNSSGQIVQAPVEVARSLHYSPGDVSISRTSIRGLDIYIDGNPSSHLLLDARTLDTLESQTFRAGVSIDSTNRKSVNFLVSQSKKEPPTIWGTALNNGTVTGSRWPIVSTESKYWLNDVSVATDGTSVVWTEDRKFFLQRLDNSGRPRGIALKLGSIGYEHYGLAVDVSNVISGSRQLVVLRNVFAEFGSCYGHEDGFITTLIQYDSGQLLSKNNFRPKYESSACDINSNS
ncbi:MAG TPA: hypothetical protein VH815_07260, partial [Acidobacteriota bacterium]